MKKIIPVLFLITLFYLYNTKEEYLIPDNAIRFRIIASSNTLEDQTIKLKIKEELQNLFKENISSLTTLESTDNYIKNNISTIENILNKYTTDFKINYGDNYFPQKTYKGITYQSGIYNSLVITLGNGNGDNFWCVLYPTLCLIDDDNLTNYEYTSLVKELITN